MSNPKLFQPVTTPAEVAGIAYRIEGELTPVLHCRLNGLELVYFEDHVMLWKTPSIKINIFPMHGAFKRMFAGMPVILTQAVGDGDIAFSRDAPGQIVPLHLAPGEGIAVREHQWLGATGNVSFTPRRQRGVSNLMFGGNNFWMDYFEVPAKSDSDGVVWVHGYGNVFEKVLVPQEEIDIEPGGWLYMSPQTSMSEHWVGLKAGLFAGRDKLLLNHFVGPGKVGFQSMYWHPAPAAGNVRPTLTQNDD